MFPKTTKHYKWFEKPDVKYSWVFLLLIPANPDNFFDFPTFVRIETSENGWTNNEIGFEWFKEIFVPQATEWNCHAIEQERANKQRQAADAELDQEDAAANEELELCYPNSATRRWFYYIV